MKRLDGIYRRPKVLPHPHESLKYSEILNRQMKAHIDRDIADMDFSARVVEVTMIKYPEVNW